MLFTLSKHWFRERPQSAKTITRTLNAFLATARIFTSMMKKNVQLKTDSIDPSYHLRWPILFYFILFFLAVCKVTGQKWFPVFGNLLCGISCFAYKQKGTTLNTISELLASELSQCCTRHYYGHCEDSTSESETRTRFFPSLWKVCQTSVQIRRMQWFCKAAFVAESRKS